MERLQAQCPTAHFVKAFNSVGQRALREPEALGRPAEHVHLRQRRDGQGATSPVVLDQFGWDVEDLGGVEAARAIEPLCILWCIPAFLKNDWAHAYKVLRP